MKKITREQATRCELALMGKAVPVHSNDEVQVMTEYLLEAMISEALLIEDFVENTINHYGRNKVRYIICNRIYGMACITYLLEYDGIDKEEGYPAPFEEDYGTGTPCAFCYTFNTENGWCSEFGDCFFEKRSDGYYHRVA